MHTTIRALFSTLLLCLSGCASIQKRQVTHPPDHTVVYRGYFLGDLECPGALLREGYSWELSAIVVACPHDSDLDVLMRQTERKMSEVGAAVSVRWASPSNNLRAFKWELSIAKPSGADSANQSVSGYADFQRVPDPLGLTIITIRAIPVGGAAFASVGYNLLFPKSR